MRPGHWAVEWSRAVAWELILLGWIDVSYNLQTGKSCLEMIGYREGDVVMHWHEVMRR